MYSKAFAAKGHMHSCTLMLSDASNKCQATSAGHVLQLDVMKTSPNLKLSQPGSTPSLPHAQTSLQALMTREGQGWRLGKGGMRGQDFLKHIWLHTCHISIDTNTFLISSCETIIILPKTWYQLRSCASRTWHTGTQGVGYYYTLLKGDTLILTHTRGFLGSNSI